MTDTTLVAAFETTATNFPYDLNLQKWTCPEHHSKIPGMYCDLTTEVAFQAFKRGYEQGQLTSIH